jgi:glutamate---cysteine ligase / carboxylate-amine ligase
MTVEEPQGCGIPDPGPGTKPGDETPKPALGLFGAFGVELEYMIVDRDSLDVRPVADELIADVAGSPESEVELGTMAWSNELALHVLELKTNRPAASLTGLAIEFHGEVRRANSILSGMGCRLLPGGMHPWMDPDTEVRLWPHEYTEVYRTFDRIFSCRGHGWGNLQSTHLNLPFQGDEEFAALHEAVRLALPILPALTASSPFVDGRAGTHLDERLAAYRVNADRVPSVTGRVIPEPVGSREEYEEVLLGSIYRDMEELDPEGVLRHEWVNARGAIARFQRGSIEIRIVDSQESAGADVAVVALAAALVRELCLRALNDPEGLPVFETGELAGILDETIRLGDRAVIRHPGYLAALGVEGAGEGLAAGEAWAGLAEGMGRAVLEAPEWHPFLATILDEGPLARRLLTAAGPDPSRDELREVYRKLAGCLEDNRPFSVGGGRG